MAEGGLYPWKVQKIHRLPVANYHAMSLGQPPAGMEWTHDPATRAWTLREREVVAVPVTAGEENGIVVVEDDCGLQDGCDTTSIPLAHTLPIVEPSLTRHHHIVSADDTFAGICLKYKITATQLRQANCFSGTNLTLAPKVLKIPHTVVAQAAKPQELSLLHSAKENQIATVLRQSKGLGRKEVRAYLEMNDWNVEAALNEIRDDQQFEVVQQGR
jgi:UBA-like domain